MGEQKTDLSSRIRQLQSANAFTEQQLADAKEELRRKQAECDQVAESLRQCTEERDRLANEADSAKTDLGGKEKLIAEMRKVSPASRCLQFIQREPGLRCV